MRPIVLPLALLGALVIPSVSLAQFTWNAGSGPWGTTTNWSPTGTPNGAGVSVQYAGATTVITTQNVVAGVTVGSVTFGGTSNVAWTQTVTNGLTLNGGGSGASITNSNTNTGTSNALIFGGGTITLADNLGVSNTGGSTNATGAVQFTATIIGTGNVTLSNASTALTQAGSIRLQNNTNTFTGSVLIQRGTVTFNRGEAFGNAANVITLGQLGQGSAALLTTAEITVPNNIVVASGTGGTTTLGGISTANPTYSGNITLNGDLSLFTNSSAANSYTFSGVISGSGGLTKVAGGTNAGTALLTNTNTYTGATTISAGTLRLGASGSINNTPSITLASGTTFDVSAVSGGYTLGGSTSQTLQGTGTVTGAVTVAGSGAIRGDSGSGTGTLNVGNVTIQEGGRLFANLGATGTNSTLAFAGSSLDFKTGSVLRLDDATGFASAGSFNLATFTNGNTLLLDAVGTNDGDILGEYLVGTGDINSRPVTIDVSALPTLTSGDRLTLQRAGNNLTLVFTPVPEPASMLAVCGLATCVVAVVRKLRRKAKPADLTTAG